MSSMARMRCFALASGNSPGNDMRFSDERLRQSRNFANKIWNAARFILMNLDENEPAPHLPKELALEDKWILSQFNAVVKEVTDNLEIRARYGGAEAI